jgi:hypothetical protein
MASVLDAPSALFLYGPNEIRSLRRRPVELPNLGVEGEQPRKHLEKHI